MNLDDIKALYEERDKAAGRLSEANYAIDSKVLTVVRALARRIRSVGGSTRLASKINFDPENGTFTCFVESYCGEGNWEFDWDGEEDGANESARIIIPVRWLEVGQQEALAEHAAQQAEKQARHEAREAEEAEREARAQEAHERALLEQLQAKYKETA